MKKSLRWAGISIAIVLVSIQFVQPDRTNLPVDQSATNGAQADFPPSIASVVRAACFDCHSNETRWPWYSYIAPVSWLVGDDVTTGRRHLNFSEWGKYTKSKRVVKMGLIYEEVSRGDMPMKKYVMMHAEARLSTADKDSLLTWIERERDRIANEK